MERFILHQKNLPKKKVAIKRMRKDWECEIDNVGNEISLLDSCHHINIVNFVKAYLYNGVIWISMEYCDAGTLKQLLQVELDERQISFVIKQVIQGVAYLHKGHRIHRDIKSSQYTFEHEWRGKIS